MHDIVDADRWGTLSCNGLVDNDIVHVVHVNGVIMAEW